MSGRHSLKAEERECWATTRLTLELAFGAHGFPFDLSYLQSPNTLPRPNAASGVRLGNKPCELSNPHRGTDVLLYPYIPWVTGLESRRYNTDADASGHKHIAALEQTRLLVFGHLQARFGEWIDYRVANGSA